MYSKSPHEEQFKKAVEREKAHQAGFHGGLAPQGVYSDIGVSGAYEAGKILAKQRGQVSSNSSAGAIPAEITLPILGVIAIGVLIFGIKLVSDGIDIRPKAHFTYAVDLDTEEKKQFANTCITAKSTRLLSKPGENYLNSRVTINGSRTVGLLDYNANNGFSKVAIKTDANPLQILFGTQAEYRHGYIPTNNIRSCQVVRGFNPENAYQDTSKKRTITRNRRSNVKPTEDISTTPIIKQSPPVVTETLPTHYIATQSEHLNIRTSPSVNGTIIGNFDKGACITIMREVQNGWQRVELPNNRQGFVFGKFTRSIPNGYNCP